MKKRLMIAISFLVVLVLSSACTRETRETKDYKPIIYLYPEEKQSVSVSLDYDGILTHIYPAFSHDTTWELAANPDGTLEAKDGKEYYALFWEGKQAESYPIETGFCVAGQDTASFLEDKLAKLGLNDREINEFIIYWLPQMENNPFNVIKFQGEAYTETAKLRVEPKPDSMIRVFMTWYSSSRPVALPEQTLDTPVRQGFTVVEWGGSKIN